ncbi:hypothetical protein BLNAU_18751 [Blattamonas nauphoetae]|uniref:Uncharacterized protein n=1 Tax=Blattamonas nauphoetae TaxID=2049346 RepID=A0ABQ9X6Q3_9EUKA|nr:hypothetical protein BLNAU_18751 [Blattamonas nauphoetae]
MTHSINDSNLVITDLSPDLTGEHIAVCGMIDKEHLQHGFVIYTKSPDHKYTEEERVQLDSVPSQISWGHPSFGQIIAVSDIHGTIYLFQRLSQNRNSPPRFTLFQSFNLPFFEECISLSFLPSPSSFILCALSKSIELQNEDIPYDATRTHPHPHGILSFFTPSDLLFSSQLPSSNTFIQSQITTPILLGNASSPTDRDDLSFLKQNIFLETKPTSFSWMSSASPIILCSVGCMDGTVKLYAYTHSLSRFEHKISIPFFSSKSISSVSISPLYLQQSHLIAISSAESPSVIIASLSPSLSHTVLYQHPLPNISFLTFSPDGSHLLCQSQKGEESIFTVRVKPGPSPSTQPLTIDLLPYQQK